MSSNSRITVKQLSDAVNGLKKYANDIIKDKLNILTITNNTLSLSNEEHQYANITSGSSLTINLPTVDSFTTINLYLSTTVDITTLTLPSSCKWQKKPTSLSANTEYDFIFTYVNGTWRSGVISYA